MDSSGYITLTRQSGLLKELQSVANNIANISTSGFRREGLVFAESLQALESEGGGIAMTEARVRYTDAGSGSMTKTGGAFDLAIDGPGFFMVETELGERLTRSGAFTPNEQGELVNMNGHRVLDSGGAPIFVPTDSGQVGVSADGTVSVNGRLIAQIGIFEVADTQSLTREDGVLFKADGDVLPAEYSRVKQGFIEGSNVEPVVEMARLIEVQRAYEMGQKLLEKEDQRIRTAVKTLGRTA